MCSLNPALWVSRLLAFSFSRFARLYHGLGLGASCLASRWGMGPGEAKHRLPYRQSLPGPAIHSRQRPLPVAKDTGLPDTRERQPSPADTAETGRKPTTHFGVRCT